MAFGKYFVTALCCSLLLSGCCYWGRNLPPDSALVILRGDELEVGILSEMAGRIVLLRRPGGENLLQSDPALWAEHPSKRPDPSAGPFWKEYGGHITWLAPQSGWWAYQNDYPEMHGQGWPPDPYQIYGPATVVEKSDRHVILSGPESPITGVRMTKEVRLLDDGRVLVRASAENSADEPRAWGLISNTRFAPRTPSYIPLAEGDEPVFISLFTGPRENPLPFAILDGFFSFRVDEPVPAGLEGWSDKASMTSRGYLAAFPPGYCFVKRADVSQATEVHPEHRFAEIYENVPAQPDGWGILELEFVGPSKRLAPGESVSFEETWEVLDYDGPQTDTARIAFLRAQVE